MKMARLIFEQMVFLWKQDTNGISHVGGAFMHLIKSPFSIRPNMDLLDVDLVTEGFLANKIAVPVEFSLAYDVFSRVYTIEGFTSTFLCYAFFSTALTAPVTIYGYSLVGVGDTMLYAVQPFPTPAKFTDVQDYTNDLRLRFQFPESMVK